MGAPELRRSFFLPFIVNHLFKYEKIFFKKTRIFSKKPMSFLSGANKIRRIFFTAAVKSAPAFRTGALSVAK